MSELNLCPRCKTPLVHHEEVHALHGELFCSKSCAVLHTMDDIILNAKEAAIEDYDSNAEVVAAKDVLGEDLQTVEIIVTCTKRILLPKSLSEEEARHEARRLHDDGFVVVEPDDCEEITVTYELVKDENSECGED